MTKSLKNKGIETVLVLLALIFMVLLFTKQMYTGIGSLPEQVTSITGDWYYIENGQKINVTLPADIQLESGEPLVLYCDGLTEADAMQTLTTRGALYRMQVMVGDLILYAYDDTYFPRNTQMASKVNCTATLPKDYDGETVEFIYENTYNGTYHIGEVYKGDADSVFLYHCYKDGFNIAVILTMIILLILCIGVSLYLKKIHVEEEKRFRDIGMFLLICCIWLAMDSSLAHTLAGSSPVLCYLSFYAFMLLSVPALHFVKHTDAMQEHWEIDLIIYAFYADVIIQSFLCYLGLFNMVDMLWVTHLLLFTGGVLLVRALWVEYRKNAVPELRTILYSVAVLVAGGLLAVFAYWTLHVTRYEVIFEIGIILFIIMLLRALIITMVQNLNYRTENLVYQRLSREDGLTGMLNRRSFEDLLQELETNLSMYQSLYLIFMDVNNLKPVNDTYGHQVGDELIIAGGRCIEKAYGKLGKCFRIGGDEFCAVLPDISDTAEELAARLDAEVDLYNKTAVKCHVSIARGISNIRDSKGDLKTISDWKMEADLKMYENKGWVKSHDL